MADGANNIKSLCGVRLPLSSLQNALEPVLKLQQENMQRLTNLQGQLLALQRQVQASTSGTGAGAMLFGNRDLLVVAFALLVQLILFVWLK